MHRDGGRARVMLVLAHSALYQFPLTAQEVHARWWRHPKEDVPSSQELEAWLADLMILGLVSTHQSYYTTRDQLTLVEWVTRRQNNVLISKQKRHEAHILTTWLGRIGWIRAVALTGSVAMNSPKANDDIDFLIITQKNRLWLTRFLVIGYALIKKKRRSFAREEANSWCFNLWLEEGSDQLPPLARTFYSAYEVCQADWILSRFRMGERFLLANHWVFPHLPNLFLQRWQQLGQLNETVDSTSAISFSFARWLMAALFDFFNYCAYAVQMLYMNPHRTRERIGYHFAYFHPKERSRLLLSRLSKSVEEALLNKWSVSDNRRIRVLVTGVFDVLHEEHVRFLQKARALGGFLLVGIECDKRVRQIKGEGRPVHNEQSRQRALEKLGVADKVVVLPTQFVKPQQHLRFLQQVKPDILAVSSHTAHLLEKRKLMEQIGGRVEVVHLHNPRVSSSLLLEEQRRSE